jgi:hypothetical protein
VSDLAQRRIPCRVRIHGRDCGAIARALHHEARKRGKEGVSAISRTSNLKTDSSASRV